MQINFSSETNVLAFNYHYYLIFILKVLEDIDMFLNDNKSNEEVTIFRKVLQDAAFALSYDGSQFYTQVSTINPLTTALRYNKQ